MRRFILLTVLVAVLPMQAAAAPDERGVKVFFLQGEQLAPVARAVADTAQPERAALRALLAGPTVRERNAAYRTAFPPGTRLVRLRLEGERAAVSLRLPRATATPFRASLIPARAAQITFTLQALGYVHVSLSVNGRSVATPRDVQPLLAPPDPPELRPRAPAPADVLGVQSQLNAIRYLPKEAVTGVWDYRTEQAVIALQSWAGLERDGVVGPRTLAALSVATIPFPSPSAEGRRVEV